MQYEFSCVPATFQRIEATLSQPRLGRYMLAAGADPHFALRLYIWNACLCEALYLPLQTAEVAARNAVMVPVQGRFGPQWYQNLKFVNLLPQRMKDDLSKTLAREQKRRGAGMTENHVIANLSFGFFVHLMTRSYGKHLWNRGVRMSFPAAGPHEDREAIYLMLDQLRVFRNNIMHHYAIFNRDPHRQYQNMLKIVELICPETRWLVAEISRVSQVINERPLA